MITTTELFSSQKYPKWISQHAIFSKIPGIRKVFPTIGLDNFEDKTIVDNSKEITNYAHYLLALIGENMTSRHKFLTKFMQRGKIGKKRRAELNYVLFLLNAISQELINQATRERFIVKTESGKVNLSLPVDVVYKDDDKKSLKKGAGLFKIYQKINTILIANKANALDALESAYQFKNFSSINIPAKETIIKFSADGESGIWDIATMSMRGVSSCQSWDQGIGNGAKVIGSMIDPFTGIIYMTTNEGSVSQYGSKMVRRCIVRYVVNSSNKKPYLLLEKMYPAYDPATVNTFKNALSKRTKLTIFYTTEVGEKAHTPSSVLNYSYIPLSEELKNLDIKYHPYCDSALQFKQDPSCEFAKIPTTKNISVELLKQKLPALLKKIIQSKAFVPSNLKSFSMKDKALVSRLRAKKSVISTTEPVVKLNKDEIELNLTDRLAASFTDFICAKASINDVANYLSTNDKDCVEFFNSQSGLKLSNKLSKYLVKNLNKSFSAEFKK